MSISSHAYTQELLKRGGTLELLAEITKVEKACRKAGVKPVFTLAHLAFLSGVPYLRLRDIILNTDEHYTEHRMAKKNSSDFRIIRAPSDSLKRVQRFILRNCVPKGQTSDISYAYSAGVGILDAARKHVGSRAVLKVDFSDFFGSVASNSIYRLFLRFGYPELLALEMALICTCGGGVDLSESSKMPYKLRGRRYLAQGAPTSGILSNLALQEFDQDLEGLDYAGYAVTRYADDITISSYRSMSRSECLALVRDVRLMSAKYGMSLNSAKTKILLNKNSYRILGLSVTAEGVGLSRPYKRKFESELFGIAKVGLDTHAAFRNYTSGIEYVAHLWGHVAFAKGIDASWAQRMTEELRVLKVPFIDVVGALGGRSEANQ